MRRSGPGASGGGPLPAFRAGPADRPRRSTSGARSNVLRIPGSAASSSRCRRSRSPPERGSPERRGRRVAERRQVAGDRAGGQVVVCVDVREVEDVSAQTAVPDEQPSEAQRPPPASHCHAVLRENDLRVPQDRFGEQSRWRGDNRDSCAHAFARRCASILSAAQRSCRRGCGVACLPARDRLCGGRPRWRLPEPPPTATGRAPRGCAGQGGVRRTG